MCNCNYHLVKKAFRKYVKVLEAPRKLIPDDVGRNVLKGQEDIRLHVRKVQDDARPGVSIFRNGIKLNELNL